MTAYAVDVAEGNFDSRPAQPQPIRTEVDTLMTQLLGLQDS